jgi:flagellar biosynthesis/type III secretory pathway protein FliH
LGLALAGGQMTSIIKSANHDQLATVKRVRDRRDLAVPQSPLDLAEQEIARLQQELAARDETVAQLREDVDDAYKRGQSEGLKRGEAQAETLERERLDLLGQTSAKALADLKLSLASTERIAALLTHQCLDKLFGETASYGEIVHALVRAQLDRLEKEAVLSVAVSKADFPDEEALQALSVATGLGAMILSAQDDMLGGGCVMQLRLGQLDIGLDQQWGSLRDLLQDIAENGVGAEE